jgi:hypothetical protein
MTKDRPGGDRGSRTDERWTETTVRAHPSVAVVERVANETGCSPFELPPLNDAIDADALDRLLCGGPRSGGRSLARRAWPTVVFSYANHHVQIAADGTIALSDTDATDVSAVDEWTHVSIVATDGADDVGVQTVSVLADHLGREPSRVQSTLSEIVDLDAVAKLGRPRGNGMSRRGASVLFSALGHDVVISANGTIAIGSTLDRLKQTGGNVLIAGAVPDELTDVASANLLGDPGRDRSKLFALLDRDVSVATARIDADERSTARVVDYAAMSRSAADVQAPTGRDVDPDVEVAAEPTDLNELTVAIERQMHALAAITPVCEPGALRLCVDSLRPVLEERDADGAVAFVESVCASVRDASALAHYVLPVDRDDPAVRMLESQFDATIELRVGAAGPQQRWHLHESGYATDWFSLRAIDRA